MIHAEVSPGFQTQKPRPVAEKIHFLETHSPLALHRQLLDEAAKQGVSYEGIQMINQAGDFAESVFPQKAIRQEGVKVYPVVHSYRVALRLMESGVISPEELGKYATIALLHDVLEDTDVTRAEIVERFGEGIARGVVLLSKKVDGVKIEIEEYFANLKKADPEIRWIKVADRIENLEVLLQMCAVPDLITEYKLPSGKSVLKSLKDNCDEAKDYIVALAEGNPVLAAGLADVLLRSEKLLSSFPTRHKAA